jgi:hypothetical protein
MLPTNRLHCVRRAGAWLAGVWARLAGGDVLPITQIGEAWPRRLAESKATVGSGVDSRRCSNGVEQVSHADRIGRFGTFTRFSPEARSSAGVGRAARFGLRPNAVAVFDAPRTSTGARVDRR